jgi:dihydroorotate dehydrogenase electron transfer subunit
LIQEQVPVISNQECLPGIFLLKLRSHALAAAARPGQFVMLKTGEGQEHLLRRPISLHNAVDDELHLLFAVVGSGTDWLARCQTGQTLDILGPCGNGFTINPDSRRLVLAAGGMGIAPLVYLARQAAAAGKQVKLLVGARTADLLLPAKTIPSTVEYLAATQDGSRGLKGLGTELLAANSAWADQIFICGPLPMFQTIARDSANLLSAKPAQVSLEVRMGCGFGLCYSCTVKTSTGLKQVCHDGPVFDFNQVDWEWLKG